MRKQFRDWARVKDGVPLSEALGYHDPKFDVLTKLGYSPGKLARMGRSGIDAEYQKIETDQNYRNPLIKALEKAGVNQQFIAKKDHTNAELIEMLKKATGLGGRLMNWGKKKLGLSNQEYEGGEEKEAGLDNKQSQQQKVMDAAAKFAPFTGLQPTDSNVVDLSRALMLGQPYLVRLSTVKNIMDAIKANKPGLNISHPHDVIDLFQREIGDIAPEYDGNKNRAHGTWAPDARLSAWADQLDQQQQQSGGANVNSSTNPIDGLNRRARIELNKLLFMWLGKDTNKNTPEYAQLKSLSDAIS